MELKINDGMVGKTTSHIIEKVKYADFMNENPSHSSDKGVAISMKQLKYVEGIPRITWTEEEVHKMNIIENLQYAVIGKFSYGWPSLEELRSQIPKQCNIKGE